MENNSKQLSVKQLAVIIFIVGSSIRMFMLPLLMLKVSERYTWAVLCVFLLLDLAGFFLLLISSKLSPDKTVYQIVENALGKICCKAIFIAYSAFSIIKMTMFLTIMNNYIQTNIFDGMQWWLYSIPLILLIMVFGMRSIRALGRTMEIFFPFILLSLIIIIYLVIRNVNLISLLPLVGSSNGSFANGIRYFPIWFGDLPLLFMFMGNIKRGKFFTTKLFLAALITCIIVFVSSIFIYAAYMDVAHFLDFGKRISAITHVSVSKLNSGRFDLILFSIWMITIILTAGKYFNICVNTIGYCIGKQNLTTPISMGLALILYIVAVIIFNNTTFAYNFFIDIGSYFAWAFYIGMPLIIFISALIGKKRSGGNRAKKLRNKIINYDGGEDEEGN